MKHLISNRLTGKTVQLLSHALNYRSANHSMISGNLANIDTPGFQPKSVVFSQELQKAVDKRGIRLKTTNRKHLPRPEDVLLGERSYTVRNEGPPFSESHQLNIDKEMAKMAKNNLLYEASARLLSKKFEALKSAIRDSGR